MGGVMKDKRTAEILLTARQLIFAGWTQGALARDESGASVEVMSETATQFCCDGALNRGAFLLFDDFLERRDAVLDCRHRLSGFHDGASLSTWNDDNKRTKNEVELLFELGLALEC